MSGPPPPLSPSRTRSIRRITTLAAALALVAGCSLTDGDDLGAPPVTSTVAGPTTTAAPSPASYDDGPCPFEPPDQTQVRCGELEVLLDRDDPDAGTITVAVARIHTKSADPDAPPVLYAEGGPGGASLIYTDYWSEHRIARQRDIILFDQRGTGYSEPNLACDAEFADAPADESDVATYERCRERLEDVTDPEQFTTLAAAQDVVDLMEELDLPPVDLLGVSYGTRLALATVALAPDRIRSVVLDSVYPPGVEAFELQGLNGQLAFEALFDLCAETIECDRAYPDLDATFTEAVEALDTDPTSIETTDDYGETSTDHATGNDLIDAVFSALYDRTLVGAIPHAIALIPDGDQEQRQQAFDVLYGEAEPHDGKSTARPRGEEEPPDSSDGLYYAVTCSEEMPITSGEEITDAAAELEDEWRAGLVAGVREEVRVCEAWDADGSSSEPLEPVTSDLPVLLLAGSLDPITPPYWAREAAETLPNSYVFELPAVGHGAMDSHLCGTSIVLAFLEDPTAEPDSSCIDTIDAPTFARP